MPNTLNPMQMQQMQYMNAPPDIQAGASEIFQRQKLAELLRQQAMEPIKADEYTKTGSGQWAAPPQIVKVGMDYMGWGTRKSIFSHFSVPGDGDNKKVDKPGMSSDMNIKHVG